MRKRQPTGQLPPPPKPRTTHRDFEGLPPPTTKLFTRRMRQLPSSREHIGEALAQSRVEFPPSPLIDQSNRREHMSEALAQSLMEFPPSPLIDQSNRREHMSEALAQSRVEFPLRSSTPSTNQMLAGST